MSFVKNTRVYFITKRVLCFISVRTHFHSDIYGDREKLNHGNVSRSHAVKNASCTSIYDFFVSFSGGPTHKESNTKLPKRSNSL